ncbi:unnamed protein product [Allacma fusca]|uniref:Uncharacterized protein n=1 Tax=Allacma fusca TaxID=39272 RepID=A0A8J2JR16_9HEXA|nr:unnamed protein product [Allacma fusca]
MEGLNNRLDCAIRRGLIYLENLFESKAYAFSSMLYTKDRVEFTKDYDYKYSGIPDQFTYFFALDLLWSEFSPSVRSKLADSLKPAAFDTLNYFFDPKIFADEVDSTSLGYTSLLKAGIITLDSIYPVAKKVFANVDENGVVEIHYKPAVKRRQNMLCAAICCNVLRLAYTLREEDQVQKTEDYVYEWLRSGKWKTGTLYYPSGFTFLYYCSTFAKINSRVKKRFAPMICIAVENSLTDCRFPLDYALALLVLENLGCKKYSKQIADKLLEMQNHDGSFPVDALWGDRYHVLWGGKALSTICIVGALTAAISNNESYE